MAWIKSHLALKRHPKVLDLAARLGVSKPEVVGHLHCFWYDVLEYADSGDISRFTPQVLAGFAEWPGDADVFLEAMVTSGWLDRLEDGSLRVHDWMDYAGPLLTSRYRKRVAREQVAKASPKQTKKKKPPTPKKTRPKELVDAVDEFIARYPDRESFQCSDETIRRKFYALVDEGLHTPEAILWLLGEWKKSEEWTQGYVTAPDKFLSKSNPKFRRPPKDRAAKAGNRTGSPSGSLDGINYELDFDTLDEAAGKGGSNGHTNGHHHPR